MKFPTSGMRFPVRTMMRRLLGVDCIILSGGYLGRGERGSRGDDVGEGVGMRVVEELKDEKDKDWE